LLGFFVKQVAIDVEREEDEGGTVGETFTDYVRILCTLTADSLLCINIRTHIYYCDSYLIS
jgi:hypothetical protein